MNRANPNSNCMLSYWSDLLNENQCADDFIQRFYNGDKEIKELECQVNNVIKEESCVEAIYGKTKCISSLGIFTCLNDKWKITKLNKNFC